MGYLNNTTITVDAILTRKGRENLARGKNEFNVTYFALADDGVDYSTWNSEHPKGTEYYGSVIEAMPVPEAVPDENVMMRHKLVTLPKKTVRIPKVSVGSNSITLSPGQSEIIKPSTVNYNEGNSVYGYTAVLADSDVVSLEVVEASRETQGRTPPPMAAQEGGQSVTLSGKVFRVTARGAINTSKSTSLTVYGNETGGHDQIQITVTKQAASSGTTLSGEPPVSLP